jgi:ribosomal protein S18 acetylase RimI-like enzyme
MEKNKSPHPLIRPCAENEGDHIFGKLIEYNSQYITEYEKLEYCITDQEGTLIAGIVANRCNQLLTIEYLWVDPAQRKRGLGRQLMVHMEAVASEKKARIILLATFSFQAPGFYKKLGYEQFGTIKNCINGHDDCFFKKELYS